MSDQPVQEYSDSLHIAVIGMEGRFPQALDVESYWHNVRDGRCSVTFSSPDELVARGVDPALVRDPAYVPAANILADVDKFDAEFFGYSPREAELMDPQHRILLECAWGALEKAGYDSSRHMGMVGVYAGAGSNTYLMFNIASNKWLVDTVGASQVMIGNSGDFLTTRLSYKLGLDGPSVNVQSACSTSLVSVVLACQGLLAFQCDMALAGGVAIDATKDGGYLYREDGIFSPDGYTRSFDAAARGTVGGNGVGLVVLKRLSDALDDGDHIHAVIRGAALNNDGARRAGFTAPSMDSQAAVITTALANADVEPASVGLVEAHGTGTILGDPIEFAALRAAYGAETDRRSFCALGAVKTNIGHLDAASGIAGFIKAVSAVEHGQIPPTLHFQHPNPRIDLADSPFYVNTELVPWPTDGPRRAGVSSFGLGGTNAHVVLEQAPTRPAPDAVSGEHLIVLSARSAGALEAASDRLADHLRERPDLSLADLAYTLQIGRHAFTHRRALVASSTARVREALEVRDDGRVLSSTGAADRHRPVAFAFTGFGDQYPMMSRRLYEGEAAFRRAFDDCAEILTSLLGGDIRDVLFDPSAAACPTSDGRPDLRRMLNAPRLGDHALDQPEYGYPAVFVVEYALVRLWGTWGIRPEMMIGHSLGEYVAACVAGVFSLADALRLVVERARLISAHGEGAMVAVPLTEEKVQPYLTDGVSVAAVNDPGTCMLAGDGAAIDKLVSALERSGVVSRRLNTRYAFHSPAMDAVVRPYADVLRSVSLNAPAIPFVSNVSGTWITAEQATDPDYWARHVRLPVRFADGMTTVWGVEDVVLVEVGPGRSLSSAALRHPAAADVADRIVVQSLPDAFSGDGDRITMLRALGRLWLAGVIPSWEGLHSGATRRRLPLPSYPFERTRYWLTPTVVPTTRKRADPNEWFYDVSWHRLGAVESGALSADVGWLVFVDESGLGSGIAGRLRALGERVVTVAAGARWDDGVPEHYVLDPLMPEHYRQLAECLRATNRMPDRLVHCWTVDVAPLTVDESAVKEAMARGFRSLMGWAQASEPELMGTRQRWDVVSTQVFSVLADEDISAVKATIGGVCRVAPQEYPALRCRQVDVPVLDETSTVETLADRVLAELAAGPRNDIVALRGAGRWGRVLTPAPVTTSDAPRLRPDGVYLITGGLGRIGLVLARSIAAAAPGARLVLTGRTRLPEDDSEGADASAAVAAVRDLWAAGASVMVCAADVSDAKAMAGVVERVNLEFGPINGVIHAAGRTGQAAHRVLGDLTDADCDLHFRPKLHGVHVLDRVLEEQPLDFAILCSSLAALLGGLGFTAYAAANAFLDATATRVVTAGGIRWTSIGWEAWSFPDDGAVAQGIGMDVHHMAMSSTEGRTVFEKVIASAPRAQVIVSTTDLQQRVVQWMAPVQDAPPPGQRHARPNLLNPYVAPKTDLERQLAGIWAELLGVDKVGVHDNFFELGGSSLIGLQVVHRLRSDLMIPVPLTVVYEGPTIRTLATLILGLA